MFTNFESFLNPQILINFKTKSHEFSNSATKYIKVIRQKNAQCTHNKEFQRKYKVLKYVMSPLQ